MSYYIPILAMVILAALFVLAMVAASVSIGPHRYNKSKFDVYECGVDAVDRPENGGRMSLKYFTIAMMFLIFDVETIFLFPWAITFDKMGWFLLVLHSHSGNGNSCSTVRAGDGGRIRFYRSAPLQQIQV